LPPSARIAAVPPETSTSAALIARDKFNLRWCVRLDGFRVDHAGNIAGAQITVAFPDGRVAPLVWLHNYSASTAHVFLLRRPLAIAPGAEAAGYSGWRSARAAGRRPHETATMITAASAADSASWRVVSGSPTSVSAWT